MKRIASLIACFASSVCCTLCEAQTAYSLGQLTDSALHSNIAMRSARQDMEAARQQRKEALTKYFPSVSATGLWFNANKGMAQTSLNPAEMITPSMAQTLAATLPAEALAALQSPIGVSMLKNGTVAGITALQPVFAGGQIVNANRLARVGEEASRLQMQLSENEVEKTTCQYFWQISSLQEKMNTVEAVETLLADLHKDVAVAVAAGVAMRNDLLQVELRQNEVQSQRLKLHNAMGIVKLLTAQYCGLSDTTFTIAATDNGSEPIMPERKNHDDALPETAEYRLMGKQVEAARLQKNIAVGQNMPSLAVGAGYNYHNLLDRDHAFAMLFATVSVPITDWWGGSYAIKRKKIAQRKAEEQLADNAQRLTIRMQNAWNSVDEARQQLLIAKRSIEQAEENMRLHRDYYRAGTCTMSSLLEAQMLYQQARDKHTDAYAELQNKILEYRQATGQ